MVDSPRNKALAEIFREGKMAEAGDEESVLIFDIKMSAEGNYIQETGEKSQEEGFDYYEILPEDQVPRGLSI